MEIRAVAGVWSGVGVIFRTSMSKKGCVGSPFASAPYRGRALSGVFILAEMDENERRCINSGYTGAHK